MPPQQPQKKISNIEWGLIIGALALVDLVQAGLDLFAVGIVVNRFIDILVALALLLIFWMKGLRGWRIFGSVIAAFGLELIPLADVLPLWVLDGLYAYSQDKIGQKLGGLGPTSSALAKRAIEKGRNTGQFPARSQEEFKNRKLRRPS